MRTTSERRVIRRDDPTGIIVWVEHYGEGRLICLWNGFAWVQLANREAPETFQMHVVTRDVEVAIHDE